MAAARNRIEVKEDPIVDPIEPTEEDFSSAEPPVEDHPPEREVYASRPDGFNAPDWIDIKRLHTSVPIIVKGISDTTKHFEVGAQNVLRIRFSPSFGLVQIDGVIEPFCVPLSFCTRLGFAGSRAP